MSGEMPLPPVPQPHVNSVPLRRYGGVLPRPIRDGKGFSLGEIKALNLTEHEARLLGVYVDLRRKTVHEENIRILKEYLINLRRALESGAPLPDPTLPKEIVVKRDVSKVFKGKTAAGRRGRGLQSVKYRYTHHYKWKKKKRERLLKKRHEATRHKGGD
ncbi:ribosomal protein L13e [Infirmifilum lucidum]|uniref:Large ribosomal subunit protein eL13 n=1 Tax=Infirmifilum lucidum TaxID=2776706 RepID=A0A7L9FIU9_9CREN|nr:ribosomal protein L13e [Infirmifilum lucidum]QOJ79699.1 ribosomal protein L13e [Infirmifilum lucidum]